MLNVNVSKDERLELEKHGFILEHNENMLIIRNMLGEPITEIIYFEESSDILVSTENEYYWCQCVKNILTSAIGNKFFIIAKVKRNKTISIEIPCE